VGVKAYWKHLHVTQRQLNAYSPLLCIAALTVLTDLTSVACKSIDYSTPDPKERVCQCGPYTIGKALPLITHGLIIY